MLTRTAWYFSGCMFAAGCGDVDVRDTSPVVISSPLGATSEPVIATQLNDAIAVWAQEDGNYRSIFASHYSKLSWKSPERLEQEDGHVGHLQIACGGETCNVVWQQDDAQLFTHIWTSSYDLREESWTEPVRLDPDGATGSSRNPSIAMNTHGVAAAAWQQDDNGTFRINVSSKIDSNWAPSQPVSLSSDDGAFSPKLAIFDTGALNVAWHQADEAGVSRVFVSHYQTESEEWSTPLAIDDGSGKSFEPTLTTNAANNALIAWTQLVDDISTVHAARFYSDDETWASPTQVSTSDNDLIIGNPLAWLGDNEEALVVWSQGAPSSAFGASASPNSDSWTSSQLFAPQNEQGKSAATSIASNKSMVAASWAQTDQAAHIYVAHFLIDEQAWGNPLQLDKHVSSISRPDVAIDDEGNIFAIWNAGFDINVHRYRPGR